MKRSKTIGIAVIALALMNVTLLIFLWVGHKQAQGLNKDRGEDGLNVLTEKLELTETQKQRLQELRQDHFRRMEPLRKQSHQSREMLHSLWSNGGSAEEVDSLSGRIGALQAQIEKNTFDHFSDIRALCTPKQKKLFDEIIKDVLKQGNRPQGPPPRGQDRRPPPRTR